MDLRDAKELAAQVQKHNKELQNANEELTKEIKILKKDQFELHEKRKEMQKMLVDA